MVTSLTIFWLPNVSSHRSHKYRPGAEEIAESLTCNIISEQGSSTAIDSIIARLGVGIRIIKQTSIMYAVE
jgi:hypothetical protein